MSSSLKKICIISDVFSGGGIETRVRGQVKYLNSKGILVDLVCGKYENKNNVEFNNVVSGRQLSSVNGQSAYEEIIFLRDYFIDNDIDLIDCHNHYSILASIAANMAGIPAVLTLHGKYCVNYDINDSSGYLLKRYTTKYGFSKVFAVAEYVSSLSSRIETSVLRNGVDTSEYRISKTPKNGDFALVTRLDDLKSPPVLTILDSIGETMIRHLHIYGDGPARQSVEEYVKRKGLEGRVIFEGWSSDIKGELLNRYDGVFGMGRVAVEALAMNIPTIILGYCGVAFAVNRHTIHRAMEMNFTSWEERSGDEVANIIQDVIDNTSDYMCRSFVKNELEEADIWARYCEEVSRLKVADMRGGDIALILNSLVDKTQYESNTELLHAIKSNFADELGSDLAEVYSNEDRVAHDVINTSLKSVISNNNNNRNYIGLMRTKIGSLNDRVKNLAHRLKRRLSKPKIVAITSYRFDEDHLDDWKRNLRGLVDDYLIVHDSEGVFMRDEGAFRRSLIEKASSMGAEWVIALDPDERLETRAIARLKRLVKKYNGKKVILRFNFRELYEPDMYRVDGVWGEKERLSMFPVLPDNIYTDARLHAPKHPLNDDYTVVDTQMNIYHLKHIVPKLRRQRADLYNHIDGEKKWQVMGYDYLDDETGMMLETIPEGRGYLPEYRDYKIDDGIFDVKNY